MRSTIQGWSDSAGWSAIRSNETAARTSSDELGRRIRGTQGGIEQFDAAYLRTVIAKLADRQSTPLNERQQDVLSYVHQGLSNIEIAGRLQISVGSVKAVLQQLFACFTTPPLGSQGSAPRRFFYGPGIENTDVALTKTTALANGMALELRFEAFNVFNHAQFYGVNAVNGNINSQTFGSIVNAAPPRICQVAAKVRF